MRIEQLEYVVAVTSHGSLRRAGERIHVSLPALSQAITNLERELGVPLLDRHRSGARISAAGRELLGPIVEVLESVARLRAAAAERPSAHRPARLGTVNAAIATVVLPAIRAYREGHPGATVEVRTLQHDAIQTGLAEGTLDVGVVNLLDGDDPLPELQATPLLVGRPVAVLPAGHHLASRPSVSADDLRREHVIAMRPGYAMHRIAHRLFGDRLPREWHLADGAEMGKVMVAEGAGVTLLPDFSVRGDPFERAGLVVARPVEGELSPVTMVCLHRRRTPAPPAVTGLVSHLREQAARRAVEG